ncbi:phosphate acyltransferase PlsX [Micromonospora sp. CPCC 205371]|nr:phosphate acyltransferase PlsX [Micromonospora sp. CPCC 205371]
MSPTSGRASPAPKGPDIARIAVDLLGGDGAPAVVVDGALRACDADPDLRLLLVGPSEVADEILGALPQVDRERVTVRPVRGAVGMADDASGAKRADTTVRAAVAAVAEGVVDGAGSAGPRGATLPAALVGRGRWSGVRRPALATTLPAVEGPVVLLDVGASVEARPGTLARNAALGAAYAAIVNNVDKPRVGLLSIGTEPGKGDRARRAADPFLAGQRLPSGARYIGLVEGYEVCLGERADVVVTDGFTGNVLLKGVEGAYTLLGGPPQTVPRAAALLGVHGIVVVCHGAAGGAGVAPGIALAAHLHRRAAATEISTLLGVIHG